MKKLFALFSVLFCYLNVMAQDVLVKKDGTIITIYNLEEGNKTFFYTLEPSKDSKIYRINKEDVFSVKKNAYTDNGSNLSNKAAKVITNKREPVTAIISSPIKKRKNASVFSAKTPDGHTLDYQILSEKDRTLCVIKGTYHEKKYVIPEYVMIDNIKYTVTEIGRKGFFCEGNIQEIQFPFTLIKIGDFGFRETSLERIILPESLEYIGECAFQAIRSTIHEIYIPSSIKHIGDDCFRFCGSSTSYRGYCQAYFSNIPLFITEGNCKDFGIDEEAVRAFQNNK